MVRAAALRRSCLGSLEEGVLDWVEVGGEGRQVAQCIASILYNLSSPMAPVHPCGQVVHDDASCLWRGGRPTRTCSM